jgi:hypothetical protein
LSKLLFSLRLNGCTLQTTSAANGRVLCFTYVAFAEDAIAKVATILALIFVSLPSPLLFDQLIF